MVTIEKRLRDLVAAFGAEDERCPECGGAIPSSNNRYRFVWTNHRDGAKDEWCSVCGRPLVTVLRWED